MNTRILMSASALVMGLAGVAASFGPHELLAYAELGISPLGVLKIQALGATYCGFAILNWMGRGNLIGGIYGRPVALGNFLHFTAVALAALKLTVGGETSVTLIVITAIYCLFALTFGLVLFTHPKAAA